MTRAGDLLESLMTPKEPLIQRLRILCSKHGVEVVAEKAGVSSEALKQVVAGTKLPTGEPSGVGPAVQRKLDAAYPNWSGLSAPPPASPPVDYADRHQCSASEWGLLQDIKTAMASPRLAAQIEEIRREAQAIEELVAQRYGRK